MVKNSSLQNMLAKKRLQLRTGQRGRGKELSEEEVKALRKEANALAAQQKEQAKQRLVARMGSHVTAEVESAIEANAVLAAAQRKEVMSSLDAVVEAPAN